MILFTILITIFSINLSGTFNSDPEKIELDNHNTFTKNIFLLKFVLYKTIVGSRPKLHNQLLLINQVIWENFVFMCEKCKTFIVDHLSLLMQGWIRIRQLGSGTGQKNSNLNGFGSTAVNRRGGGG